MSFKQQPRAWVVFGLPLFVIGLFYIGIEGDQAIPKISRALGEPEAYTYIYLYLIGCAGAAIPILFLWNLLAWIDAGFRREGQSEGEPPRAQSMTWLSRLGLFFLLSYIAPVAVTLPFLYILGCFIVGDSIVNGQYFGSLHALGQPADTFLELGLVGILLLPPILLLIALPKLWKQRKLLKLPVLAGVGLRTEERPASWLSGAGMGYLLRHALMLLACVLALAVYILCCFFVGGDILGALWFGSFHELGQSADILLELGLAVMLLIPAVLLLTTLPKLVRRFIKPPAKPAEARPSSQG